MWLYGKETIESARATLRPCAGGAVKLLLLLVYMALAAVAGTEASYK